MLAFGQKRSFTYKWPPMAKWNCSKTEVVITNHNAVITDEVKAIIKILNSRPNF